MVNLMIYRMLFELSKLEVNIDLAHTINVNPIQDGGGAKRPPLPDFCL